MIWPTNKKPHGRLKLEKKRRIRKKEPSPQEEYLPSKGEQLNEELSIKYFFSNKL
jgi:hypothetical protein